MLARDFDVGRRVIYVPNHAKGDINHPDAEHGVVTSTNPLTVFVRFDGKSSSQGCYPDDLQYELGHHR